MAAVAGTAKVLVVVHSVVVSVGFSLVVLVTVNAAETAEIAGDSMTIGAVIPSAVVRPGVDRKI